MLPPATELDILSGAKDTLATDADIALGRALAAQRLITFSEKTAPHRDGNRTVYLYRIRVLAAGKRRLAQLQQAAPPA